MASWRAASATVIQVIAPRGSELSSPCMSRGSAGFNNAQGVCAWRFANEIDDHQTVFRLQKVRAGSPVHSGCSRSPTRCFRLLGEPPARGLRARSSSRKDASLEHRLTAVQDELRGRLREPHVADTAGRSQAVFVDEPIESERLKLINERREVTVLKRLTVHADTQPHRGSLRTRPVPAVPSIPRGGWAGPRSTTSLDAWHREAVTEATEPRRASRERTSAPAADVTHLRPATLPKADSAPDGYLRLSRGR
jgi:hypothetical protein